MQENISRIEASTWQAVHRVLVSWADEKGLEKGRKIRVDATGVQSNIRYPLDSQLLYDSIRVVTRLLKRLNHQESLSFVDHSRRAKRRCLNIRNSRGVGYNVGQYFTHWLNMGKRFKSAPKIFHVNWFRTNQEGKFIWPGFGENLRVLDWILKRVEGNAGAQKTAIGFIPHVQDINCDGLDISEDSLNQLLSVDKSDWMHELENQDEFLNKIGDDLPAEIRNQHSQLKELLQKL